MKFSLFQKKPKIGLALGGGGPKGLAHIGVLKILELNQISIDCIAGTSAGAIVGAFYAATKSVSRIEEYIMDKNWWDMISIVTDPSLKDGILQGKKAQRFIEDFLGKNLTFDELKIPFKPVAVDLATGNGMALEQGLVCPSVLASCTVPMLFKPVAIDGKLYVDGGVTNPVPVEAVRKMGADIVIAVNLNKHYSDLKINEGVNLFSVARHSFSIMMHNIANYEVQQADLIVTPHVDSIHWKTLLKEDDKKRGIMCGEQAMLQELSSLKILVESQSFIKKLSANLNRIFGKNKK